MKKCGYVTVLGETNAGKSTFVNQLVGQKVCIVSRKIQTTITRILGIAIHDESQIILIDTPGFLRKNSSESLAKISWDAFRESDNILFLIDANKKNLDGSIALLKKIDENKNVSLVINKVDLVHKPKLLELAMSFSKIRTFEKIFMVSSLSGNGCDDVRSYLSDAMPEGDWIYNDDEITDLSMEQYVAEITREHIYHRLHQEIPYKCVVKTEEYSAQKDGSIKIVQNIVAKTSSHRAIFLGRKGEKIKAIGVASRNELEKLLDCKVHLFLHVIV